MAEPGVLVVDESPQERERIIRELTGLRVIGVESESALHRALEQGDFDVAVAAAECHWIAPRALLERLAARHSNAAVIFRAARPDWSSAVTLLRAGAFHYLAGPADLRGALRAAVDEALGHVRRRAEQSEADARFRLLADAAPVMIWVADPGPGCTYFNQGWLRFTGRSVEEELGDGWTAGLHAEDLPRVMQGYSECFAARRPFILEYRLRRFDGVHRWIRDQGVPRFASDGSFCGFIGSCVDVSDHREADARLHETDARYRILVEHAHDMISQHTLDGTFPYASPACERLLGYENEELFGRSPYDFFHPDDVRSVETSHGFILDQPASYTVTYRFRRKDGSYARLETTSQVVRDRVSGAPVNIVCISRDVSERRDAGR